MVPSLDVSLARAIMAAGNGSLLAAIG